LIQADQQTRWPACFLICKTYTDSSKGCFKNCSSAHEKRKTIWAKVH